LKLTRNLSNLVTFCFFSFLISFGQCNLKETITICDIAKIDFDTDGTPDGVINLYNEYFDLTGKKLDDGTWRTKPDLSFTLDSDTGKVFVWDLKESVTDGDLNKYEFELFNSTCGSMTPAVTIKIEIGAFSGTALPAFGINDINLEVCEAISEPINLFEALVSSGANPSPHLNGT